MRRKDKNEWREEDPSSDRGIIIFFFLDDITASAFFEQRGEGRGGAGERTDLNEYVFRLAHARVNRDDYIHAVSGRFR